MLKLESICLAIISVVFVSTSVCFYYLGAFGFAFFVMAFAALFGIVVSSEYVNRNK